MAAKSPRKRDWNSYEANLKARGAMMLTIIFPESIQDFWITEKSKKRGRPKFYPDPIIESIHYMRSYFKLNLRGLEGFVSNLFNLMGLELPTPDHTTLSRRLLWLNVPTNKPQTNDAITVVLDSTGLKISGEKEWMQTKHGVRPRKTWRKLHLAVSEDGEILASELTTLGVCA